MAEARTNRTVVGVFQSMDHGQRAFDVLQNEGFSRDDISFIANKNTQHGDDAAADVAADAGIGAALGGVAAATFYNVHASHSKAARAAEILNANGAVNIERDAAGTASRIYDRIAR